MQELRNPAVENQNEDSIFTGCPRILRSRLPGLRCNVGGGDASRGRPTGTNEEES
jgi:hypothetical protein